MGDHPEAEINRKIAELDYESAKQEVYERIKFQVDFAQSGLKNLIIINGGAIIALFTVLGHNGIDISQKIIWWSFLSFSIGITASICAYVAAFYSQLHFMNSTIQEMWNSQAKMFGRTAACDISVDHGKGMNALKAGVVSMFTSLLAFIMGAGFSLSAVI